MVEIRWLIEAKDDLKDIFDYFSHDSERYAQHQLIKLSSELKSLNIIFAQAKLLAKLTTPGLGNYRIIYRIVSEKQVHILMIHHGARNLASRIEKI